MIISRLYTDYAFDSKQKAEHFLLFLQQYPSILLFEKYGLHEPLKHSFIHGEPNEAANMLSGYAVGKSGDLILKGKKNKFLCWIRWSSAKVMEWTFWFDDKVLQNEAVKKQFLQFIADLSFEFHVIFGGIATEDEWRKKHWEIINHEDGGETHSKKGLDWVGSFPGLYWTTIFGERLYEKFIKNNTAIAPYIVENQSKAKQVTLLQIDNHPFDFDSKERIKTEIELISSFGERYFFDIRNPNKKLDGVFFLK